MWLIWGILALLDNGGWWLAPTWGMVAARVVALACLGLAALLGSIVANKASSRLSRMSVPWYQVAGSIVVLICASAVASALRLMLIVCQLAGQQTKARFENIFAGGLLAPDLERVWSLCLLALLMISAITVANLVAQLVRGYRKAEVQ
jgi:uncharacterized protein YybS (DUF2232 family)